LIGEAAYDIIDFDIHISHSRGLNIR
jgi:hypothetical protein